MDERRRLASHPLSYDEKDWRRYLIARGLNPRHSRRLLKWYSQSNSENERIELAPSVRNKLHQDFFEHPFPLQRHQVLKSIDGTIKYLLKTIDDQFIECVYIPQGKRGTLCVSSQVGCSFDCSFCATARLKSVRNLRSEEIVAQLALVNIDLANRSLDRVTNVVFMGMGEPLANLRHVVDSIRVFTHQSAYAIAARKITVSTVGLAHRIPVLARSAGVHLAISLHAPTDELRNRLMPINRRWPLERLLAACAEYTNIRPKRDITIEYLMLARVNDTSECCRRLAIILRGLPVKLNLIPYNPNAHRLFHCSSPERIDRFAQRLRQEGYVVTVRHSRGRDVAAACGQLAGSAQVKFI